MKDEVKNENGNQTSRTLDSVSRLSLLKAFWQECALIRSVFQESSGYSGKDKLDLGVKKTLVMVSVVYCYNNTV